MSLFKLLLKSIQFRKQSLLISMMTIALSLLLLLFVESLKTSAKSSFTNTISKTDLIVGEKGGRLQLILYSLFHLGSPINNISYESYEEIKNNKKVKWTIPLSFGDGHRGFRVIGTNNNILDFFHYRNNKKLNLKEGHNFRTNLDVIIGSKVAKSLNYSLGKLITISHGIEEGSSEHDHLKFKIVGILDSTQTPIDKAVLVSLEAIELLHDPELNPEDKNIETHQISSFLLGLKSRIHTLHLQRSIEEYEDDSLMAVIPALELNNLWSLLAQVEKVLLIIFIFVLVIAFLNMIIAIISSLNERKKEMAILRSLGLSPLHIFLLLIAESVIVTLGSLFLSLTIFLLCLYFGQSYFDDQYGLSLSLNQNLIKWLAFFLFMGPIISIYPALQAYKQTLKDGLSNQ